VTGPRRGHLPVTGRSRTLVLVALVVGAVLIVAYWAFWFAARDVVASDTNQAYYDFENAFPLADAWLLGCLLGALTTLVRRSHWALFWLLVGGGAGVYLGCMDSLYDVEHGIWGKGAGGLIELCIVAITFVFGVSLLRWAWRRRHTLLALESSSPDRG
jgi:hypothetical protein